MDDGKCLLDVISDPTALREFLRLNSQQQEYSAATASALQSRLPLQSLASSALSSSTLNTNQIASNLSGIMHNTPTTTSLNFSSVQNTLQNQHLNTLSGAQSSHSILKSPGIKQSIAPKPMTPVKPLNHLTPIQPKTQSGIPLSNATPLLTSVGRTSNVAPNAVALTSEQVNRLLSLSANPVQSSGVNGVESTQKIHNMSSSQNVVHQNSNQQVIINNSVNKSTTANAHPIQHQNVGQVNFASAAQPAQNVQSVSSSKLPLPKTVYLPGSMSSLTSSVIQAAGSARPSQGISNAQVTNSLPQPVIAPRPLQTPVQQVKPGAVTTALQQGCGPVSSVVKPTQISTAQVFSGQPGMTNSISNAVFINRAAPTPTFTSTGPQPVLAKPIQTMVTSLPSTTGTKLPLPANPGHGNVPLVVKQQTATNLQPVKIAPQQIILSQNLQQNLQPNQQLIFIQTPVSQNFTSVVYTRPTTMPGLVTTQGGKIAIQPKPDQGLQQNAQQQQQNMILQQQLIQKLLQQAQQQKGSNAGQIQQLVQQVPQILQQQQKTVNIAPQQNVSQVQPVLSPQNQMLKIVQNTSIQGTNIAGQHGKGQVQIQLTPQQLTALQQKVQMQNNSQQPQKIFLLKQGNQTIQLTAQQLQALKQQQQQKLQQPVQQKFLLQKPTIVTNSAGQKQVILTAQQLAQLQQQLKNQQPAPATSKTMPAILQRSRPLVSSSKSTSRTSTSLQQSESKGVKRPPEPEVPKVVKCMKAALSEDQNFVLRPDFNKPFASKGEAFRKLSRYHVQHEPDQTEKDQQKYDALFHLVSGQLLKRSKKIQDKFRHLVMEDSQRADPSAEMVMLYRVFLADEKAKFAEEKLEAQENGLLDVPQSSASSTSTVTVSTPTISTATMSSNKPLTTLSSVSTKLHGLSSSVTGLSQASSSTFATPVTRTLPTQLSLQGTPARHSLASTKTISPTSIITSASEIKSALSQATGSLPMTTALKQGLFLNKLTVPAVIPSNGLGPTQSTGNGPTVSENKTQFIRTSQSNSPRGGHIT